VLWCRYFRRAFKTDRGFEFTERWIDCYHPNWPDKVQGRVKVTLELLSKARADDKPNGYGRGEPNQYPVLPPPNRPDDSFNPLNPLAWIKYGAKGLKAKVCGFVTPLIIFLIIIIALKAKGYI